MDLEKLIQLFESADSTNCQLAFLLMTSLKEQGALFSPKLLQAAASSLEIAIKQQSPKDEEVQQEIWTWVTEFNLPLLHTPALSEWLAQWPIKCIYYDLKGAYPFIKEVIFWGQENKASLAEKVFECPNLDFLSLAYTCLPLSAFSKDFRLDKLSRLSLYKLEAESTFYDIILSACLNLRELFIGETSLSRFPDEITGNASKGLNAKKEEINKQAYYYFMHQGGFGITNGFSR